jgi:hypothetical protein
MHIFYFPSDFVFNTEQCAQILGCCVKTVINNIQRKNKTSRYYLKARKNSNDGPYLIYAADLREYIERTYVGSEIRTDKKQVA